uniref:Protein Star-like n=1 Tax=Hirondellea gigas TaxID=1518452 RepID=A0A6A7FUD2_9CRUS
MVMVLLYDGSNTSTSELGATHINNSTRRPKPVLPPKRRSHVEDEAYNDPGIAEDDPRIVQALREKFLFPPSDEPYNLVHNRSHNPSIGQQQVIDKLLRQMRGGFYVECGGFDGESYSNSLTLERERGWKGLLVEPDSKNFQRMKEKNRKAYIAHSCLAETPYPKKVLFQRGYYAGHIMQQEGLQAALSEDIDVEYIQCFPLYSFMVALNVSKIDYFSLDVEGSEYDVLRNIPWDKVDISTLSVEYHSKAATYELILELMKKEGYVMYTKINHYTLFADDFIFVKKEILDQYQNDSRD